MAAAYYYNYFRTAMVVLICFDASDVLMEAAKLARYCGAELACSVLFVCFALSWVFLRLYVYPTSIMWAAGVDSLRVVGGPVPAYRPMMACMFVLLLLNTYWFYLIGLMIVQQLRHRGKVARDIRSDSD